jgi:thiosulfate reductase cytochrome b subunit
MAESAAPPILAIRDAEPQEFPRHAAFVRVTHWVTALGFVVLVLSGFAILLAHPRLYWGETGSLEEPSLLDLPLPFVLHIPIRGPGRYLHFLAAWVSVFTGLVYLAGGLAQRHFGRNLLPARGEVTLASIGAVLRKHLQARPPTAEDLARYNAVQRLSYSLVVFVLGPLMVWTGLAMSPAVVSVFPFTVTAFGGQQSARTIHFFAGGALVLFALVHVALVWQGGFWRLTRRMLNGRSGEDP